MQQIKKLEKQKVRLDKSHENPQLGGHGPVEAYDSSQQAT